MNPITALLIANPSILKELVGFRVETFYYRGTHDNYIVFWEKLEDGLVGRSKALNAESFTRKCLEKINEIQKGN